MKTKGFNFKGLKLILQSSQKDLLLYFSEVFTKTYGEENCELTKDYLFARGKNDILLVAHLDTVHISLPDLILFDSQQGIIWSPQGIGGDDRGGVYSILVILSRCIQNNKDLPSILFTTDEEKGCIGAGKAAKELKEKAKGLKFAIELDRKGSEDMVFYDCKNKSFEDYIGKFGFKSAWGSSSDIRKICPEWDIAGVNLSHGVYNCHTKEELIYVDEMFDTIDKVMKILEDEKSKKFTYKTATVGKQTWKQSGFTKEELSYYQRYGRYWGYDYEDDYGYGSDYPLIGESQKKVEKKDDIEEEVDDDVVYYTDKMTRSEQETYGSNPQWDYLVKTYGIKWAKAYIDEVNYANTY